MQHLVLAPFRRAGELGGWEREGVTACLRAVKALLALGRVREAEAWLVRARGVQPANAMFQFYLDVVRSKARKAGV